MHSKLEAALSWAQRGFRVFPLQPYGKRPVYEDFPTHATTDPTQIRAWWSDPMTGGERLFNIGVCTTGFVVVDVDVKKGRAGLDNYVNALGGTWDTLVVKTPTGGYHCYFHGPDSGNRAGLLEGVDIRSHNGYVIAPGSFVSEDGVQGEYTLVADLPMAHVPPMVYIELAPPGEKAARIVEGIEYDTAGGIAHATEWLILNAPLAIEGQNGNDTTYKVASRLVRDYALTEHTALGLMLENWNERCSPPWTVDELHAIVDHASQYGSGNLGAALPSGMFGNVTVIEPPKPEEIVARPPIDLGIFAGNAPMPVQLTPRPWLVKGLLLLGENSVISANGAGGKSSLTIAMTAHFAVGRDFGPYTLTLKGVPIRSVVYNAEDDLQEQGRKLYAVCQHFNLPFEEVHKNITFITKDHCSLTLASAGPGGIVNKHEDAIDFLVKTVNENDALLLTLDPLVNMHACNENDNPQMRQVMGIIEEVARRAHCSALTFHHTNKDTGGEGRAGNASISRGAGSIVNSTRVSLTITSATQEDCAEHRIMPDERYDFIRLDHAKGNYERKGSGNAVWLKWHSTKIMTGDVMGVPAPYDMGEKRRETKNSWALLLHQIIIENGGPVTLKHAADQMQQKDNLLAKIETKKLQDQVRVTIAQGVMIGVEKIVVELDKYEGREQYIVKLA